MTLMQRRRALMGAQSGEKLPDEFQQVSYVEVGPKKLAYIDTGIQVKYATTIIFDATVYAATDSLVSLGIDSNGTKYAGYFDNFSYQRMYIVDKPVPINTSSARDIYTFSRTTGASWTQSLRVMGNGSGTRKIRVYSIIVYNNNAVLWNGIPCYRKSDNVIGFYDTVSKTFFANAGSGSFTKGADV